MADDVKLGTVWAEVQLKTDQIGTAKNRVKNDLGQIGQALDRLVTEAEKSGKRTEDALSRISANKAAQETKRAADAAKKALEEQRKAAEKAAEAQKKAAEAGARAMQQSFASLQLMSRGYQLMNSVLQQSLQQAGDFEQAMNVLQHAAGATTQQMDEMSAKARELGADLTLPATSSVDAAHAMLELVKAGLSVEDAMNAAKGSLQLAAAAGISAGQAAATMGQLLNVFSLSGDQATHVADLLAAAANAAAGDIGDFALAMKQFGPVAHMAGVSVEDATAAITAMARAGILGSDAGTSLKTMLLALQNPSDEARKVMKTLGITIYDAHGVMKPFPSLIDEFTRKISHLTPEQRDFATATIFGSDAVRAANVVMLNGKKAHDDLRQATDKDGAAAESAAAKMAGFNGAVDALKSAIDTFLEGRGKDMLSWWTSNIRLAGEAVEAFDKWLAKKTAIDNKNAAGSPAVGKADLANVRREREVIDKVLLHNRTAPKFGWGSNLPNETEREFRAVFPHGSGYGFTTDAQIDKLRARRSALLKIERGILGSGDRQFIQNASGMVRNATGLFTSTFGKPGPAPKPVGTQTNAGLANLMTGDKSGDKAAKNAAQLAEQLKRSMQRASEMRAEDSPRQIKDAYDDLLKDFREAKPSDKRYDDALGTLRTTSRNLATSERRAAQVRLANAAPGDKPAAQAAYDIATSKNGTIAREEKQRQDDITDIKIKAAQKEAEEKQKRLDDYYEEVERKKRAERDLNERTAREENEIDDTLLRNQLERGEIEYAKIKEIWTAKMRFFREGTAEYQHYADLVKTVLDMEERSKMAGAVDVGSYYAETPDANPGQAQREALLDQTKDFWKIKADPFKFIGDSMIKNVDIAKLSLDSMKDFTGSVMDEMAQTATEAIAEIAKQWAIMQLGQSVGAAAGPLGSLFGSFVGAGVGKLFGGFRESGGPVAPGRAYVVGEKRPELFVPKTPGFILPNTNGFTGGGGTTNVTIHVASMNNPQEVRTVARQIAFHTRQERRVR